MVEKDASAHLGCRMDVDLKYCGGPALRIIREILTARTPERVSETMRLNRVKALEVEQRVDKA